MTKIILPQDSKSILLLTLHVVVWHAVFLALFLATGFVCGWIAGWTIFSGWLRPFGAPSWATFGTFLSLLGWARTLKSQAKTFAEDYLRSMAQDFDPPR